ncbi:ly6/PLAUR domain-containing protein 3, partial [Lates japonicus]
MQLYGVLAILFMTLSTACGLRCYTCTAATPKSCTLLYTCPAHLNRCSSLNENGLITKGCQNSGACFYGVLTILFMTLSTAYGIKCYSCGPTDPKSCTTTISCSDPFDCCFSLDVNGVTTKGCQTSALC